MWVRCGFFLVFRRKVVPSRRVYKVPNYRGPDHLLALFCIYLWAFALLSSILSALECSFLENFWLEETIFSLVALRTGVYKYFRGMYLWNVDSSIGIIRSSQVSTVSQLNHKLCGMLHTIPTNKKCCYSGFEPDVSLLSRLGVLLIMPRVLDSAVKYS